MGNGDWKQLWAIFEAAVDLPERERDTYLKKTCGDDLALRERVAKLINSDAREDGPLDRGLDHAGILDVAEAEPPGAVGPYRIEREIGRGGAGQVFLGTRSDPSFKQKVAIKLIPLGRYSQSVQKRFMLERQILSDLDHENIARLLDGGITDEGIPYLIMEYIDGVTIDEYCDSHRLNLDERLALFRQVCEAVHYAHRQLVVHRDIKPGNVMVDQAGRVKLLDFGVAKLLDAGFGENAPATETLGRMATPEYASPEQLRGDRLSTATDIYSLGVLLYQLLTGRRPIAIDRSDLAAAVSAITLSEPIRPSQLQRSTAGGPEARAPAPKLLRGDLDNIVMLALRKDPERRYGSAALFAQDIERYLGGFPVQARAESVGYRIAKFVRRHPIGVAATALTAAILAALTVTSFMQAKNLELALGEARLEQQKSAQIADFLQGLFKANDPYTTNQGDQSTQALLSAGAERIETELADQPALQAALMKTMADVYVNMSLYDEAQSLARRALAIFESINEVPGVETQQARLTLSRIAYLLGDYETSLSLCEPVIDSASGDKELKSAAQLLCAGSLTSAGRYTESIALAREVLRSTATVPIDQRTDAHNRLGNNYWFLAEYDLAREHYEATHEALTQQYGEAHPRTAASLGRIASVDLRVGALERAESLNRKVLEQTIAALGRDHRQSAAALNETGVVLLTRGKYPEAEDLFQQSVDIYRKLEGHDSTNAMRPMVNLALLFTETQRLEEALATHAELLEREIQTRGPDFWRVGLHLNNRGLVYQDLRQLEQAEDSFRRAQEVIRGAWGSDHPGLAYSINNLAIVLHDQGRSEEAEPLFQQALELRRNGLDSDHPALAATLHEYGRFLLDADRVEEAQPLIEQALKIRRAKLEAGDWRTRHTAVLQGVILASTGDIAGARALILPGLAGLQEELGADHWRTQDARRRATQWLKP